MSRLPFIVLGCCAFLSCPMMAQESGTVVDPQQIRELIEQNKRLQQQVDAQQKTIDELKARMTGLENSRSQTPVADQPSGQAPEPSGDVTVRLSGEFGFAYFDSGPDGAYSNGQFRMDDGRVFLDASVWKNVFLHSEMDLLTREAPDQNLHFGEVYATAENISGEWGQDDLLNMRVGRFYAPFGEEYQMRFTMEDPLVSHSVADLWDLDSGVEGYGQAGRVSYAAAVQNGALSSLQNFHSSKSFAGRIGLDPAPWLHLSMSAMRTGTLNAALDKYSAMWIAGAFFRSIGPAATTTSFGTSLFEGDAELRWKEGHLLGTLGSAHYTDNNRAANDARNLSYFSLEGVQHITEKLYGAVRYSGIQAPGGYPLAGQGNAGEYAFGNILTTSLYRLSMGLGYQFGAPVVLKVDYSPEWGHTTTPGVNRDQENLFSTELGVKF